MAEDSELINMSGQFRGLPMKDLIGGPLQAASDAQTLLATATANFIKDVGFVDGDEKELTARTVDFTFKRPSTPNALTGKSHMETVDLEVPLLALINTPSLAVKETEINFTMSVTSSDTQEKDNSKTGELTGGGGLSIGPFQVKVNVHGQISAHSKHTRHSDNSAKYDVRVLARADGPPEGLMKVLDMLQTAIAPIPVKT